MADQLWLMTRIREEEEVQQACVQQHVREMVISNITKLSEQVGDGCRVAS